MEVRLLYGATIPGQMFLSTDLLWRTKFQALDPFFLCEFNDGESILLIKVLEYERAKKEAKNCTCWSLDKFMEKIKSLSQMDGLIEFLRGYNPSKIIVPSYIPFFIVEKLTISGFNVISQKEQEMWYPQRAVKTPLEIQYISEVQRKTEKVVYKAINLLRESRIADDGTLIAQSGKVLTSERVRRFMAVEFVREGCMAANTIIACGDQAVDPHCHGFGPLRANRPIIIDVFPRSTENWYWADMTRTVFKGQPTEEARKMYQTVLNAQGLAMGMIRAGVDGSAIQAAVTKFFEAEGYQTGEKDGITQGFFHSVGHGLGLDIHETPGINLRPQVLPEGAVVTVEPGLYYLGIGGIRIEDLVVVQKNGLRNLTSFPKDLDSIIIP